MKYELKMIKKNLMLCKNIVSAYEVVDDKMFIYDLYYESGFGYTYYKKPKQILYQITIEELEELGFIDKKIIDEQIKIFNENLKVLADYDVMKNLFREEKFYPKEAISYAIEQTNLIRKNLDSYKNVQEKVKRKLFTLNKM